MTNMIVPAPPGKKSSGFHSQRIGLLAIAALGLVGCVLPWARLEIGSGGLGGMLQGLDTQTDTTQLGVEHWRGWLSLAALVAAGVIACLPDRSRPLGDWQPWAVLGLSAVVLLNGALLIGSYLRANSRTSSQLSQLEAEQNPIGAMLGMMLPDLRIHVGIGLWMATICGPLLAGIVFLFMRQAAHDASQQNYTPPASFTPPPT